MIGEIRRGEDGERDGWIGGWLTESIYSCTANSLKIYSNVQRYKQHVIFTILITGNRYRWRSIFSNLCSPSCLKLNLVPISAVGTQYERVLSIAHCTGSCQNVMTLKYHYIIIPLNAYLFGLEGPNLLNRSVSIYGYNLI